MAPTDDVIEDEADQHPGHKVERGRWRHRARTREDDRKVEVLEDADLVPLLQNPLAQRCDGAEEEEEDEAVVQLSVRE